VNPSRGTAFIERMLDQMARRLTAAGLHPVRLRDEIIAAFDQNVVGRDAPNDLRVALNLADFGQLSSELDAFKDDIVALLEARVAERGWSVLGNIRVDFTGSEHVPRGRSRIEPHFTHPTSVPSRPSGHPTRRLSPMRQMELILPGGHPVRVTHLPFTLGRGPDNDLILASMAVSRRHAELIATGDGVAVRDAGSFNGVVVNGQRVDEATLADGTVVVLGDLELVVRLRAE